MFREKFRLKDNRQVLIRDVKKTDNPRKFLKYINDIVEERNFIMVNRKLTLKEEQKWLKDALKKVRKKEAIYISAEYKGRIVSVVHADRRQYKEYNNVELGIAVSKDFRGSGLGRRMMEIIIKRAKNELRPRNLFLNVSAGNTVAISLYKKMGFKQIALLPKWTKHKGKYIDKLVMLYKP